MLVNLASQTPTVKVYVGAKVADGTEAASTFTTFTEQSVPVRRLGLRD